MPRAEDQLFSFWFNKLKLLEKNNSPEGNITVQPIKYRQGQQKLSCWFFSPVSVIVEKRVPCKPDLDIMPKKLTPKIKEVLLFPLLHADKNKLQIFSVILCFLKFFMRLSVMSVLCNSCTCAISLCFVFLRIIPKQVTVPQTLKATLKKARMQFLYEGT